MTTRGTRCRGPVRNPPSWLCDERTGTRRRGPRRAPPRAFSRRAEEQGCSWDPRSRESHARGDALTPRARPPVLQVWAARTPHLPLGRGRSGPAPPGKALGTPGKGLSGGRSPGARAAGLRGGPSPSPPRQQIGHMTDSVKWGFLAAPTPGMK